MHRTTPTDPIERLVSEIEAERPDAERIDQIRRTLQTELEPVRPLPPDGALILLVVLCFGVFSLIATIPFGFLAWQRFSAYQKLLLYPTITGCALLCSAAMVGQMIPGSNLNWRPSIPILGSLFSLAMIASIAFSDFALTGFVRRGIPCLRLGVIMAGVAFGLIAVLMRKGLVTCPLRAGLVGGGLAGLAGVCVLALHCPIQNAPHVLVWHLAVIVAACAGGLLFGWVRT